MPPETDELDILLREVRKTIQDNRKFLQTLEDDAAEADDVLVQDESGREVEKEEDFEEL